MCSVAFHSWQRENPSMPDVKGFLGLKASELSLTPTNTPQTTLRSSTQLFTLISAPHTQVTLMFRRLISATLRERVEAPGRPGRGCLTVKTIHSNQQRPLLPSDSPPDIPHSSTEDLLSFPLDLCLFCQHPPLLIHTIHRNRCSYCILQRAQQ